MFQSWIFAVVIIGYNYSASASENSNEKSTPSIEGTRIQEKEEFIPSLPQNRRNPKLFFGVSFLGCKYSIRTKKKTIINQPQNVILSFCYPFFDRNQWKWKESVVEGLLVSIEKKTICVLDELRYNGARFK